MQRPDPRSQRSQLKNRARKKREEKEAARIKAVDMYARGFTLRAIAKELETTGTSVARWVNDAKPAAKKAPKKAKPSAAERVKKLKTKAPAEDAENTEPDAEIEEEELDTLGTIRRMQRNALKGARDATADGNHTAAQRYTRDAAGLVPVIARLEKDARAGSDVLHISMPDIEEAMIAVEQRIATLASRPLRCEKCSRELSIEYGLGKGHKSPRKE